MYENQQARKQRLYKWLKNTNAPVTEKEVASAPDVVSQSEENWAINTIIRFGLSHCQEGGYLKSLFSLVVGQQLPAACQLAQKNKDHKLALLLSQAIYTSPNNK